MALAQLLQMLFFGGLAVSFIGKGMLPQGAQDRAAQTEPSPLTLSDSSEPNP